MPDAQLPQHDSASEQRKHKRRPLFLSQKEESASEKWKKVGHQKETSRQSAGQVDCWKDLVNN